MTSCLVCGSPGPFGRDYILNIFDKDNTTCERKLTEALTEMIDKELKEESVHTTILCKECLDLCINYDMYKANMALIKTRISEQFYATLEKLTIAIPPVITPKKEIKGMFVVPASKLQPLPPDYQLNLGKIAALASSTQKKSQKPLLNLKVTIGNSVLTQSLTTSTVKMMKPTERSNSKQINVIGEWNDSLPSEIFSNNDNNEDGNLDMEIDEDCKAVVPVSECDPIRIDANTIKDENSDNTQYINAENFELLYEGQDDGQPRKNVSATTVVTRKCAKCHRSGVEKGNLRLHRFPLPGKHGPTRARVWAEYCYPEGNWSNIKALEQLKQSHKLLCSDHFNDTAYTSSARTRLNNFAIPIGTEGILLRLRNEELKDRNKNKEFRGCLNTIVLDSNSSILQMMSSGQKLVYENGEISLVMDDDDNDEEGNDEGQDSNDEESQIELQVSGDEETANAIIAAAQEQGGAFIKVESGEMYRVKSVQSHPSDKVPQTDKQTNSASGLVRREGDSATYTCLVCPHSSGPTSKSQVVGSFNAKAQEMLQHMKFAHSAKVYICAKCGAVMRNRSEYAAHLARHGIVATKPRSYDCDICKKSYNSRTLLQEHMNIHTGSRPYRCQVCDKTFASKYTMTAHLKTHQARPRPFKCVTCHKSFLSQQNLNQHEKTHLGIKNFVCATCDKAFATQHSLESHYVVHSGTKNHVCDVCDKRFARRAELKDHVRIHTGERPFACNICDARFSQRSNLHSHKRATHLNDKRHACPECAKRFKRRRLLQYHIKAAHTGERPLVCKLCQTTFVYPEHYKKHIRIHSGERPYYCEICGKAFNSRDNRNTHRFVHSDKKPYECLACGASYMRKRMLVAHMNANGHLAESIVVNQPRVTRVAEGLQGPNKAEIEDSNDTDNHGEQVTQSGNVFSLVEDNVITDSQENAMITVVSTDSIQPHVQMTNENGNILQFIQVKMPDGKDGWMTLND